MVTGYTKEFLELLDPRALGFTFQTFSDSNSINIEPYVLHETFDKLKERLASQNRRGAGVFVTVNETDLKGRKAENIVKVRAVWQDDDKCFEGELPLEPTLEIKTSPGKFHRYWIIDPEYGEMSFETFNKVMSVLVEKYGSDPNARDLSRVLRLPGSLHMKNTPGHLVKIVGGSKERYPAEVIADAFGVGAKREVPEKVQGPKLKYEWDWMKIQDALAYLPSEDRSDWFKYGAAIHYASGGSHRGFEIWDKWSQTTNAGNYDFDEQHRYWQKEFKRSVRGTFQGTSVPSEGVTEATIFHDAMANGWEPWEHDGLEPKEVSVDDSDSLLAEDPSTVNLSSSRVDGDEFPNEVIKNLRKRFTSWGHLPTEAHWNGLSDMAKVFHRMAAGVLRPQFFLSSLPPGMGKTSVVIECTKTLLNWDKYLDEGVIYFLSRLEEINSLVDKMGLQKDEFAVLVSEGRKGEVPEGNPDRTKARILFTTQQQLEARSKGGKLFAEMDAFYYRGKPRGVRVWDETITPSRVLTLTDDDVQGMRSVVRDHSGEFRTILKDWARDLEDMQTGEIIEVPDVQEFFNDLQAFRELFPDPVNKDKAEALWRLSGRSARVRRDKYREEGVTALEYEENLPDDLAPMLILDASGGLRETYSFWERHRKGLIRLEAPQKEYKNQTIHVWDKGSGKKVYQEWKKVKELAEGISLTINQIPSNEDVLVIHSKQRHKKDPDITRMIREGLNYRTGEVHFCNWGKHTATNQYAHIRHVILAGILQYNEAQYEAVGRGAKKSLTSDEFPEEDFHRIRFGEITHNILQAACRGAVRKSIDRDCPEGCHLYIITPLDAKRGMTVDGIKKVFPGSPVIDWFEKELTGKAKEAFDYIVSAGDTVTSSEVMSAIGMSGAGNFANLTKRDDFKEALAKAGIELVKARGRGAQSYFQRETKKLPWAVSATEVPLPF